MNLSAGLIMYRRRPELEIFIVHPGGPFFRNKDEGSWSIPKGLVEEGEDPLDCAAREFAEETGLPLPRGPFTPLGEIRQRGGKLVRAWAFHGDCDPARIESNSFELEWPPRSGRKQSFPEIDRALFVSPELAKQKLNPAQAAFVDRLVESEVAAGD